jgi:hypothetical protein
MTRRETHREAAARRGGFLMGFAVGAVVVLTIWQLLAYHVLTVTTHP